MYSTHVLHHCYMAVPPPLWQMYPQEGICTELYVSFPEGIVLLTPRCRQILETTTFECCLQHTAYLNLHILLFSAEDASSNAYWSPGSGVALVVSLETGNRHICLPPPHSPVHKRLSSSMLPESKLKHCGVEVPQPPYPSWVINDIPLRTY
jgi:hypothetical protein